MLLLLPNSRLILLSVPAWTPLLSFFAQHELRGSCNEDNKIYDLKLDYRMPRAISEEGEEAVDWEVS